MIKLLSYVFLFVFQLGFTQQEQAWVFFKSKKNINEKLKNPSLFFTQKALLRKEKFDIEINEQDLPINNSFISILKNQTGIAVHAQSKWLNAVYLSGEQPVIETLKEIDFIDNVFFLNKNLNQSLKTISAKKLSRRKTEFTENFEGNTTDLQINQINLKPLQRANLKGRGITIAVMDSGFPGVDNIKAFEKARNNNQILGGYDFVDGHANIFRFNGDSHGTNTLSTMLGYIKNEFIGSAIDANYYLFRTEDVFDESPLEEAYWIAAAEKADSLGVDIISTSLGYNEFRESKYNYEVNDMDGNTTFISRASNIASSKGMLLVTSAGNSGTSPWKIISAPADAPNVFSIGAVKENKQRAIFSSTGPTADFRIKPDIVALGVSAAVIRENGTIGQASGTSFSGPLIAGAMASLMQAIPDKNPIELMNAVRMTSSLSNNPNNQIGYGVPDFEKALKALEGTTNNIPISINNSIAEFSFNITDNQLALNFPDTITSINFFIFNITGSLITSGNLSKNEVIDISSMSRGVYFLRLEGEKINTYKFIK